MISVSGLIDNYLRNRHLSFYTNHGLSFGR